MLGFLRKKPPWPSLSQLVFPCFWDITWSDIIIMHCSWVMAASSFNHSSNTTALTAKSRCRSLPIPPTMDPLMLISEYSRLLWGLPVPEAILVGPPMFMLIGPPPNEDGWSTNWVSASRDSLRLLPLPPMKLLTPELLDDRYCWEPAGDGDEED